MLKIKAIIIVLFLYHNTVLSQVFPNFGGERAGLSALVFLKNELNPRSMALSGAGSALNGDAFSCNSNPASMARLEYNSMAISDLTLGAGVHQSFATYTLKLPDFSSLGISINSLNSGYQKIRTEFRPDGNGLLYTANNTALGIAFAKQLSERFGFGVNMNLIGEYLAEYRNYTATLDLGFLYKTDFKDLQFAVCIKNFGGNSSLSGYKLHSELNRDEVQLSKFTVPTIFEMGFSIKAYQNKHHKLLACAELNHPNDNSENIRLGLEYQFGELLQLRLGYKISVAMQRIPTAGIGYKLKAKGRYIDLSYAINPTNKMGNFHLFGLSTQFLKRKS